MSELLDKAGIAKLDGLNADAIKTYLDLAQERLVDALDTKKQLEQKAFILFGGYITAALALFGLSEKFAGVAFWLNITAIVFCVGVVPLFLTLKAADYGTLGRHPRGWLEDSQYLTVKPEHLSHIHAYMLYDQMLRIDTSDTSNDQKARYLNIAVLVGAASLIPFAVRGLFAL